MEGGRKGASKVISYCYDGETEGGRGGGEGREGEGGYK